MPKFVALVLGLWLGASVTPAQAQRKELTVLVGGTLSGATGDYLAQVQERTGFAAGLSLRLPRTARFSFETQLLVVQRRVFGQRAPSSQTPIQSGPLTDAANLIFLEVPILLRFQRGYSRVRPIRPFMVVGPYVGVLLDCRRQVSGTSGGTHPSDCGLPSGNFNSGTESYIPALFQEVDLGLLGGLGVEVRQFTFTGRFERSLRNLVEPSGGVRTSPFDGSRVWTVQFSVEYLIRVL